MYCLQGSHYIMTEEIAHEISDTESCEQATSVFIHGEKEGNIKCTQNERGAGIKNFDNVSIGFRNGKSMQNVVAVTKLSKIPPKIDCIFPADSRAQSKDFAMKIFKEYTTKGVENAEDIIPANTKRSKGRPISLSSSSPIEDDKENLESHWLETALKEDDTEKQLGSQLSKKLLSNNEGENNNSDGKCQLSL